MSEESVCVYLLLCGGDRRFGRWLREMVDGKGDDFYEQGITTGF